MKKICFSFVVVFNCIEFDVIEPLHQKLELNGHFYSMNFVLNVMMMIIIKFAL